MAMIGVVLPRPWCGVARDTGAAGAAPGPRGVSRAGDRQPCAKRAVPDHKGPL
jgi:hypothetical protein